MAALEAAELLPSDETLVERICKGSVEEFDILYRRYFPRIYRFIARRIEDRSVAEDLTATTFERALGAVRREDFRNASFGGLPS